MKKALVWLLAIVVVAGAGGYAAYQLSPWPRALLIRWAFDREAEAKVAALAKHVPAGVTARLDQSYDSSDPDARFDVFHPAGVAGTDRTLPTVVWVHGGAWLSGNKSHVANYLKILAARGYTTVGVGYSIAPGKQYPTPIRQVNAALAHLRQNAARLNIDPSKMFIAGDSAGSQITGQLANLISSPDYARQVGIAPGIERAQLRGVILHCGAYDAEKVNLDGAFGGFLRTVLWSYFGTKDFLGDPRIRQFSVLRNIGANFPPIFISAGNGDPLGPQSHLLAEAAQKLGVPVDSLFFPDDYKPPLPHEYQFNLELDASRQALERTLAFLAARSRD